MMEPSLTTAGFSPIYNIVKSGKTVGHTVTFIDLLVGGGGGGSYYQSILGI